jgi:hypothetical protein
VTGGGLLTPYGRSLSRQELSTFGRTPAGATIGREEQFLYGALGKSLGPVQLGIELRPSHLDLDIDGTSDSRNFLMNADLLAAYRGHGWTVYGELGRQPGSDGAKIDSYEYWVAHETGKGLGFRAGRFLPAYGVRFADHTAFTRSVLGFEKYDQVFGLELIRSGERTLAQVSLGPGYADALIHDDGRQSFTATGRFQYDISPRSALVVSGLFRDTADRQPGESGGGLAFGFAPTSRLSIWTDANALFQSGTDGAPAWVLGNETAFEAYRGVWLKFSPQLRTDFGDTSGGVLRLAFEANLLPRTHWNLGLSYYRDKSRVSDLVTKTLLAQLHLYL